MPLKQAIQTISNQNWVKQNYYLFIVEDKTHAQRVMFLLVYVSGLLSVRIAALLFYGSADELVIATAELVFAGVMFWIWWFVVVRHQFFQGLRLQLLFELGLLWSYCVNDDLSIYTTQGNCYLLVSFPCGPQSFLILIYG